MTTGGKPKLLGISKRGNRYLRKNLIHGARAVLPLLVERDTPLGRWVKGLLERAHKNTVVVALANKLARIASAVLTGGQGFGAEHAVAARDEIDRRAVNDAHGRRCLRAVGRDDLTVERQCGNLGFVNGLRGRADYEDRTARISILAGGIAPRPDTLKQTDQGGIVKPSVDGTGHTLTESACGAFSGIRRLSWCDRAGSLHSADGDEDRDGGSISRWIQ
ncbi:hypothetical protein FBZ90_108219 [Nitrospirillum pindoramense]|uniref:Transposase IS116/IS110/IS902 family protein n=1 Tax=Nitrospirillum amazonense TaxID=28077 RepID=A0A560H4G2_9PROT|nr:hypothetical protein FBZ90_108219 [Nitrospirillum amazonense]